MAAAYAGLVSLMNTVDQIKNHHRLSVCLDKEQIKYLLEKVDFLLDYVEGSHSHGGSREEEVLESQIAYASNTAEDVIESHVADQIHSLFVSLLDLQTVIEGMDSVKEKVVNFKEETRFKDHHQQRNTYSEDAPSTSSTPSKSPLMRGIESIKRKVIKPIKSLHPRHGLKKVIEEMDSIKKKVIETCSLRVTSPRPLNNGNNTTVGFDGDFSRSMENIFEQQSNHQIPGIIMTIDDRNWKQNAIEIKLKIGLREATDSMPATPARRFTTGKSKMAGFDKDLIQLMEWLTGQQSSLQIIPIVGMGGIGKTTLARKVYENAVILHHFDIRAWATISHSYSVLQVLSELVSCMNRQNTNEKLEAPSTTETEDRLGERLYKSLSGRRYLIILDDIWITEAWEKIKSFFPHNNNRSRIIVTTRLSNVAVHFGRLRLVMNFLNEDESWNLFCQKAFAEEGCPSGLEKTGKNIAKKFKGLPLAIATIGGLVQKSKKTLRQFKNYERDIVSVLNSQDEDNCLNILSLSYRYLPIHLKPCFLYMGIFEEDHEISLSRLIKLWVAEGFLKSKEDQSLEKVAESYLKDLVDRNLILVHKRGRIGNIKTCKIHDLLRDLCLREAKKEKFFCVMRMRMLDIPKDIDSERRIVVQGVYRETSGSRVFPALSSTSLARSLVCEAVPQIFECRLLRVLEVVRTHSLEAITNHANLRYVAYNFFIPNRKLLSTSISLLWNLQTLIIRAGGGRLVAPFGIWFMPQLRHLELDDIRLPDPPLDYLRKSNVIILRNLQTLEEPVNFKLSEEVCKRIANVKKLKLMYDEFFSGRSHHHCLHNLARLHKLESLSCSFDKLQNRGELIKNLTFPSSIKKLSLENWNLHWDDLTLIGSLPHLEVLILRCKSVLGNEWNPVQGGFLRLKFLEIRYTDLIYWNADSSHFPVLEGLTLKDLTELDEIPVGIGEIPTLRLIDLYRCSDSAAVSAMKVLEEQESFGNEGLQVRIFFFFEKDLERFKNEVKQIQSFTSNNLILYAGRRSLL